MRFLHPVERGRVKWAARGGEFVLVGMKNAPKIPPRTVVITNSPEELEKFFAACAGFKQSLIFQTFWSGQLCGPSIE